ncbi:hypothetical protein AB6A40_001260 [Gnathostoma spinigerum]|uniref:Uncharacterized protein n=1 Tax=Gnathostoma spinigerum TaxID=75299 RepID=A0ABD6E5Z7_9BILA
MSFAVNGSTNDSLKNDGISSVAESAGMDCTSLNLNSSQECLNGDDHSEMPGLTDCVKIEQPEDGTYSPAFSPVYDTRINDSEPHPSSNKEQHLSEEGSDEQFKSSPLPDLNRKLLSIMFASRHSCA